MGPRLPVGGIDEALPHEDIAAALRIAQAEFDHHQPLVDVGPSRGRAVAMNIDSGGLRRGDAGGPV
jgi:hypothetical protein